MIWYGWALFFMLLGFVYYTTLLNVPLLPFPFLLQNIVPEKEQETDVFVLVM
jgi:hypothetical protein